MVTKALKRAEELERQGMLRRAAVVLLVAEQECESVGVVPPALERRRNELAASLLRDEHPAQLVARALAENDPVRAQPWWDRARTRLALDTNCYGALRVARWGGWRDLERSTDGSLWGVPIVVLPGGEKRWGVFRHRPNEALDLLETRPEGDRLLLAIDANGYVFEDADGTHLVRLGSAKREREEVRELAWGDVDEQRSGIALNTPWHLDSTQKTLEVLDWPALTPRFTKQYEQAIAAKWVGSDRLLVELGDAPTVDTLADGKLEYQLLDATTGDVVLSGNAGFVGTVVDREWMIRGLLGTDWLIEVYSLRDGRRLRSTHVPIGNPVVGWRIGWEPAPNGQLLLTDGDNVVYVLDVQTGVRRKLETQPHELGLNGNTGRIGVTLDGRHFCQHAYNPSAPCDVDWAVDFVSGAKNSQTPDGRRYACYAMANDFVAVAHAEYPHGALTGPDRKRVCNQYIRSNASSVSPQGTHLALLEVDAKSKLPAPPWLVVMDVETGKVLHDIPLPISISADPALAFSRDGRYVAAYYDEHPFIADVTTGELMVPLRVEPGFVPWSPSRVFGNKPYREEHDVISLPLEHPLVGVQELKLEGDFLEIPGANGRGWDLLGGRPTQSPQPTVQLDEVKITPSKWGSLMLESTQPIKTKGLVTFVPLSARGAVAFYPGGNAELLGNATIESAGLFCDFCGTVAPAQVCQDEQVVHDAYARALRGEDASGFASLRSKP